MKTLLLCSGLVASAFAVAVFPPNMPHVSTTPASITIPKLDTGEKEGSWEGNITAASEDPDAFRVSAIREIESYARGASAMSKRCEQSRTYMQTRLNALQEHADYARMELLKLPASTGETDYTDAHAHFYVTMNGLRGAFSQAMEEVAGVQ